MKSHDQEIEDLLNGPIVFSTGAAPVAAFATAIECIRRLPDQTAIDFRLSETAYDLASHIRNMSLDDRWKGPPSDFRSWIQQTARPTNAEVVAKGDEMLRALAAAPGDIVFDPLNYRFVSPVFPNRRGRGVRSRAVPPATPLPRARPSRYARARAARSRRPVASATCAGGASRSTRAARPSSLRRRPCRRTYAAFALDGAELAARLAVTAHALIAGEPASPHRRCRTRRTPPRALRRRQDGVFVAAMAADWFERHSAPPRASCRTATELAGGPACEVGSTLVTAPLAILDAPRRRARVEVEPGRRVPSSGAEYAQKPV